MVNPISGTSYADTADIPTDGTKPSTPEGKVQLASDPGMTIHKEQLIGSGSQTWSHTFVPTPKWTTFGINVGQQHPYYVKLFEKDANGNYVHKDGAQIYVTRT